MNTIKLSNHFQSNATLVSNYFIDNYMATANGEFVKVYLFLLWRLVKERFLLRYGLLDQFGLGLMQRQ